MLLINIEQANTLLQDHHMVLENFMFALGQTSMLVTGRHGVQLMVCDYREIPGYDPLVACALLDADGEQILRFNLKI